MKLKRFIAPDTRSAMQKIKAALGPDAVILSSTKVPEGIEVVAAIDFDSSMLSAQAAIAEAEPKSQTSPAKSSPMEEICQEIVTLRSMVEAQLRVGGGTGAPLHSLLMQKLLFSGVSPVTAGKLLQNVQASWNKSKAWEKILSNFGETLAIRDSHRIEDGGAFAFVGATGVGKTTTMAKIAARFVLRHGAEKLGLITMDTYRIAAQEQVMLYGKIFGVQVSVAQDALSLARVLRQLSDKKLILIDTPGMNPADERVVSQMEILHAADNPISNVLVLPATSHYQVLKETIHRYQSDRIDQCIITKIDESRALGGVLSALAEEKLAVSYLTHGQRVPEDIKLATRHQLMEQYSLQEEGIEEQLRLRTITADATPGEHYVME